MNRFLEKISITFLLKLSTIFLLGGRAWQHLVWNTPHSEVLWDETWWGHWVEMFGVSWDYYANNIMSFRVIDTIVATIGIVYLITALLVPFYKKGNKVIKYLLFACSINLIFMAFCYMKGKSLAIGQFWEYTIQFSLPVLLYYWIEQKISKERWLFYAKLSVALSFTCHGLYAAGFYAVPGNFIDMTISITGLSQSQSYIYLLVAGILDFIVAIGIFMPHKNLVRNLLLYATVWGILTSLARIVAYVSFSNFTETIGQYAPQTIYRLPHGLLPFIATLVLVQYANYTLKAKKIEAQTAFK